MNKTYLRLFLSIISITIVVLLAEIMYFVASTVIIDRRWKAQVFTQYMTSFHEKVGDRSYPATAFTLFSELMDSAPDRVSGVLLRDSEGRPMLSVGRTGRGEYRPQLKRGAVIPNEFRIENVSFPPEFSISVESTRNVERIRINRPKVIFEADTSVVGRDVVINDLRIYASGDKGKMFVEMPEGVESSDIAGTIAFVENDREIGYLDIIVFDVGFYGPTYMLIRQITNMFMLFLPVALLFSFIAGYFISQPDMFSIAVVAAIVGAVIGLVIGIFGTKEWFSSPLASKVAEEMAKRERNKIYVRDQYGNKKEVKQTGKGILGETYYRDEDGNTYQKS